MTRIAMATACVALWGISSAGYALADCESALDGFREVQWGSYPPYDLNLTFTRSTEAENLNKPLPPYAGLPVREEFYEFSKANRLIWGALLFEGEHFERLKTFLTEEFGKPSSFSENGRNGYWRCVSSRRTVTIQFGDWLDGKGSISVSYDTR